MEAGKQDKNNKEEREKESRSALGRYSGLAFQMLAAVVGGFFLGRWLDTVTNTTKSHAFLITFTVIGVILGMYMTIKEVLKK
jgi:F0F1-type ATP synthase assembly protein I